jgi:hypothetical protein
MTRIRNLTLLATLAVAALAFPAMKCELDKPGPAVVTPITIADGQQFQLVAEGFNECDGTPIQGTVTASANPVSTSDQSPLPIVPTAETVQTVAGAISLTPITSVTVYYSGQVGAEGFVSKSFDSAAFRERVVRFYLEPVGGCPEPLVCDEPEPCPDCEGCPACPVFPYAVTLDQCLAGPAAAVTSGALSPAVPMLYCCNTNVIGQATDADCDPYRAAP